MLLMLYFLGFSYYYYAVAQRMELPHENYLNIIVFGLQAILWLKLFRQRSWLSPYHIFFSGILGLLFTVDTLGNYEKAYSGFFQDHLFYGNLFAEAQFDKFWATSITKLKSFDQVSFYALAFPSLIVSSLLLGDLYRTRNEKDPNKSIGLCLFSPFVLVFLWKTQNPILLLLPIVAITLSIRHYLWKSLFSGIILCLNPVGILFIASLLSEYKGVKKVGSLISSLIPIAILYLLVKDLLVLKYIPIEIQHYLIAAGIGLTLSFVSFRNTSMTEGMPFSISLLFMFLCLLAIDFKIYLPWSMLLISLCFPLTALSGHWPIILSLIAAKALTHGALQVPQQGLVFYALFLTVTLIQAIKISQEFQIPKKLIGNKKLL